MWFEAERFINRVFESCYAVWSDKGQFNAEAVIVHLNLPPVPDGQDGYWQKKNVTNSLNVLERAKLISGTIQPEYTTNLRLLKEVRYGEITSFGKITKRLPTLFRGIVIFLYLRKQKLTALLGTLAFVKLAHNAYIGTELLSGWLAHIAALIILYIVYLLIRKIID